MRNRYEKSNEKAIKRGLNWLSATKDVIIRRGMVELLQEASAYAIELHDAMHFGHRIAEDSHGWALVKDGSIVMMQVNAGNHGEGHAREQMRDVADSINNKGYVGIILASMTANREDGRPIIFAIDFEMDVLNITADAIRANFYKFFRPI